MLKIEDQFIVSEPLLVKWEKKAISNRGLLGYWRFIYLILGIFASCISLIFGLPLWKSLTFLILVLFIDYLAYRRDRRFRLAHELKLLRKFLDQNLQEKFYQNDQAGSYERDDIEKFGQRSIRTVNPVHYTRKLIVQNITNRKIFSGQTLLDIGCHYGLITETYKKGWKRIIGMDLQQFTISEFKRRMKSTPVVADARHLPFKPHYVDGISFLEIVEHLVNPFNTLREINRSLPEGGRILLTTNNRSEIYWEFFFNPLKLVERGIGIYIDKILPSRPILWRGFHDQLFYYHTAFSKRELSEILKCCGFHLEYTASFFFVFNLFKLFALLRLSFKESTFSQFQLLLFIVLNKVPIIKHMGSHWLIVARKSKETK